MPDSGTINVGSENISYTGFSDLELTSQFQALSNKSATGQPSQYFVQRFIDHILITLYLTPGSSEAGNVINFYYEKRIQDAGAYTNATDVPYRFVPCMVAGLTYYLSMKYAQPRIQDLKLIIRVYNYGKFIKRKIRIIYFRPIRSGISVQRNG
jgi:hypothetical protein